MPVPTHSRSTSKSTSTAADETRWQSAQDIRRNLGVGPYALLKLACEGLVLTKNAPAFEENWPPSDDRLLRARRAGR